MKLNAILLLSAFVLLIGFSSESNAQYVSPAFGNRVQVVRVGTPLYGVRSNGNIVRFGTPRAGVRAVGNQVRIGTPRWGVQFGGGNLQVGRLRRRW